MTTLQTNVKIPPRIDYHSIYFVDVCSMIHHRCGYVLPKITDIFNTHVLSHFICTSPADNLTVADVVCLLLLMVPA